MIQKLLNSIKSDTKKDRQNFNCNLFYFNIFNYYFVSFRLKTVVMIQKLLNSIKSDTKKDR